MIKRQISNEYDIRHTGNFEKLVMIGDEACREEERLTAIMAYDKASRKAVSCWDYYFLCRSYLFNLKNKTLAFPMAETAEIAATGKFNNDAWSLALLAVLIYREDGFNDKKWAERVYGKAKEMVCDPFEKELICGSIEDFNDIEGIN